MCPRRGLDLSKLNLVFYVYTFRVIILGKVFDHKIHCSLTSKMSNSRCELIKTFDRELKKQREMAAAIKEEEKKKREEAKAAAAARIQAKLESKKGKGKGKGK